MGTGECFGNVVSDGKLVRNSGGLQNAQFGIRKDGTMVFGYLSEEDVLDEANPFVQLVSGVVWLLRGGEVYISQSQLAECSDTQTTGSKSSYLLVEQVNLWEMAEFLKQQGLINAINLDGGGSATLILNGTLASYPSEHCMWRCPRNISTVVCIHEPSCEPTDCSGHGTCVQGQCRCAGAFWRGPACDILDCGPSNCSLHGVCTDSGCLCDAGWTGSNCSEECPVGWYGPNCQERCPCEHSCPCDQETGSCNITSSQLNRVLQPSPTLQAMGCCSPAFFLSHRKTWITTTSVLALLLVISAMGNIGLFFKARSERRHEGGDYLYQPLRKMNGEASPTSSLAAWETEDAQDQNQALL
uniref:N-acetylglucosamine-1-phosphodiester alpha-N-acetylglucosaminidase n=1 Tax=Amazona collaria TaxID=241587 RepID=A0A8B9G2F4_9PSIT